MWDRFAEFTIAKSFDEAIENFDFEIQYDLILLDHDLGNRAFVPFSDPNTGSNFVNYIKDYKHKKVHIVIHSHNPSGVDNMYKMLIKYNFSNVKKISFGTLTKMWEAGTLSFLGHYKYDEI
jgi:hypothetical protein